MGQFIRKCGLAGAGALLLAATPVFAGGHVVGRGQGFGGPRMIGPGRAIVAAPGPTIIRPGPGPGFRPGPHMGYRPGAYGPRPTFFGAYGRFGYDFGYAYPRRPYGPFHGRGAFPNGDFAYAMPIAPYGVSDYPAYPEGYGDASYTPTGYGVSYNVPPPMWSPPKIIYIKGNHAVRERFVRPRQVIVVRGSASVD
ncbi:hypothetical protein QM467_15270 [Rhodoblastus sp. 17X3]|uniref:hypothetical protein n=1 Tax=Rhodoblastus sp. 17X3 TaxID=3047026 RepID=UPI0024B68248|nr:hypothetical protein [Rhodoblastus sp. 17X3]MDI9849417.1 hypothetical protein [Rhodoblastus sp. 17X3]